MYDITLHLDRAARKLTLRSEANQMPLKSEKTSGATG